LGVPEAGGKSRPLRLYRTSRRPPSTKGAGSARRSGEQAISPGGAGSAEPKRGAGFAVYDPVGQKVGSAVQLFVNRDGEPVYIRVRIGPLWNVIVYTPDVGLIGFDWLWVILALLLDIGHWSASYTQRHQIPGVR
jgi:hypothetical protein